MRNGVLGMLVAAATLLAACDTPPPSSRPLDGAPVGLSSQITHGSGALTIPPTLAPAAEHPAIPTSSAPPLTPPSQTMTPTHVITATGSGAVNLRAGPSMHAPIITTLREGSLVETTGDPVSAEGRDWQPIRSGDQEGWVIAVVVHER